MSALTGSGGRLASSSLHSWGIISGSSSSARGRNNGSTCLSHDGAVMATIAEPLILARAETGALIFTFCLFTKKPLKLMIKYFELSDGAT